MKNCLNCKLLLKRRENEKNSSFVIRKFCNQSCSASFNNSNRKHSDKTKKKIKQSLIERYKKLNKYKKPKIKKRKKAHVISLKEVIECIIIHNLRNKNQVRKHKYLFYKYIQNLHKDSQEIIEINKEFNKNIKKYKVEYERKRMNLIKDTIKKYETLRGFYENNPSLYQSAKKIDKKYNGFLKEISSHTINNSSKKKRAIYAILFTEIKSVYVGLSYNIEHRYFRHKKGKKKSKDNKITKLLKNKEPHVFLKLTEYISEESAQIKEDFFIKEYRKKGFKILNSAKAGSLGAGLKYKDKEILDFAKKCKNYDEFKKNKNRYSLAQKRKLLKHIKEKIFKLKYIYRPNQKYPKDIEKLKKHIFNEAKKYSSYKEFTNKNQGLYEKILYLKLNTKIKELFNNSKTKKSLNKFM